jgi:hypothetical protein
MSRRRRRRGLASMFQDLVVVYSGVLVLCGES